MVIIALILWILIWGLAGFFTARTIQTLIETRRVRKSMAAWNEQRIALMKHAGKFNIEHLGPNPFESLSKKES